MIMYTYIISLGIVSNAIPLLEMDKDELLPLVHQSWQPLKLLFQSENIFIVAKAFQMLHVFARYAKEFIHRRTLTDVLPPILNYLKKLDLMVKDREMHQTLIARQSRLLQKEMIEGLWEFMALLELNELDVDPIISQMIDFVNSLNEKSIKYENVVFQEPAKVNSNESNNIQYFDPIRPMDSDILWLKLSKKHYTCEKS